MQIQNVILHQCRGQCSSLLRHMEYIISIIIQTKTQRVVVRRMLISIWCVLYIHIHWKKKKLFAAKKYIRQRRYVDELFTLLEITELGNSAKEKIAASLSNPPADLLIYIYYKPSRRLSLSVCLPHSVRNPSSSEFSSPAGFLSLCPCLAHVPSAVRSPYEKIRFAIAINQCPAAAAARRPQPFRV